MSQLDKKALSERDICAKFITPAIVAAGWDVHYQLREEVNLTKGRVIVKKKLVSRALSRAAHTKHDWMSVLRSFHIWALLELLIIVGATASITSSMRDAVTPLHGRVLINSRRCFARWTIPSALVPPKVSLISIPRPSQSS